MCEHRCRCQNSRGPKRNRAETSQNARWRHTVFGDVGLVWRQSIAKTKRIRAEDRQKHFKAKKTTTKQTMAESVCG